MKNGTYGNSNTDFTKLRLSKFPVNLFDKYYSTEGCGATALALITGDSPKVIRFENKNRDHFSDKFVRNYLRKHQIKSFEVHKCNLTSRNTSPQYFDAALGRDNLILSSLLIKKKEASWFVFWQGFVFHNFEVSKADYEFFLSFPVLSQYVLYKKDWALSQ